MINADKPFNPAKLHEIFKDAPLRSSSKGKFLSDYEDWPDKAILVVDGYLAMQTKDRINGLITHAIFGQDEVMYSQLLKFLPRQIPRFYSLTDSKYKELDISTLMAIVETNNDYKKAAFRQLMYQLEISFARTENMTLKYAEDKIIYRLLYFAKRFGVRKDNTIEIQLPLTHQLLASGVSLSRERVSKALSKMENGGLISSKNKKITILDPEKYWNMIYKDTDDFDS